MTTPLADLRHAVRQLLRSPGFALVATLTLALGIGANTAVFSALDAVLIRPLPYHQPERLVALWPGGWLSQQEYGRLRDILASGRDASYSHLAAWAGESAILTGGETPERLEGRRVDAGYLGALAVRPLLGRGIEAADTRTGAPPVVVLSHTLWQRRFAGDPEILGRRVEIEGEPHTVVGVLPAGFRPLEPDGELWLPLVLDPTTSLYREGHYLRVLARLREGVSIERAQEELKAVAQRENQEHGLPDGLVDLATVTPLREVLTGASRPRLLMMMGAVVLVLLIACANVANLLLARAVRRQREVAIRTALGAGRRRLIRQLLTEASVLALVAGAAGLLLAYWTVPWLAASMGQVPAGGEIAVDPRVLAFTVLVALGTALLFGLAPAWLLSRIEPQEALAGRGATASAGRARLQSWLVGAEVALALVLVVGAGLLGRSLWRLEGVDPGFRPEGLVSMTLYLDGVNPDLDAWRSLVGGALERIATVPGVISAGAVHTLPIGGGGWIGRIEVEGRPDLAGDQAPASFWRAIDPGYFATLGVPILHGRSFGPSDRAGGEPVAVVNQTLARRLWPEGEPLGKQVRLDFERDAGWATVVGVVADMRVAGLASDPQPVLYRPFTQSVWQVTMRPVLRSPLPAEALAREVQQALATVDRRILVADARTFPEVIRRSTAAPRQLTGLVGAFAALALTLGVVGIYGVLAYVVGGRTGEIGLRIALGARRADVLGWALRQGMTPVLAGLGAGLAGAWAVSRWLGSQLYGVGQHDPWTFVLAPLVLALAAAFACWLPARRAAGVDPVTALHSH